MSQTTGQESVIKAVQAYIAQAYEAGTLPPPLLAAFQSSSLTLLQLIRILGEYLTSEEERVRSRGVELLSQVIVDLAPGEKEGADGSIAPIPTLFDRQAVRTLTIFLADKLEDGSNVAALIAKETNASDKVTPGSAPSYRFKAIPEGTEMLACSLKALKKLARLDGFGSGEAKAVAQA